MNNRQGFTLVEVLISIVLLAFISLAIYQATSNAFNLRERLLKDGDFYTEIRLATGILGRDIALLFSPKGLIPPSKDAPTGTGGVQSAPKELKGDDLIVSMGADAGLDSDYWDKVGHKTGIRLSRFIGEADKITFVAASHLRVYKEAKESIFSKITYEVRPDKEEGAVEGTKVLVKTESVDVFNMEEDEEKIKVYPLLHGIKEIKFKYYQKKEKDFTAHNSWDTEFSDFKEIYPNYIEMEITVVGSEKLSFEARYKFKPEIPFEALSPTT